ncbi:MAG: KEOPS complex subunit Pcc1 [Candidatus Saliniplasma sp.]
MSKITCKVVLEYNDTKSAELIASSVSPDNEGYIELEVKGTTIECFAGAETPKKLLHTLDDFLACVAIAEENI